MERWIFTSNKNFKFILSQLGYFKEQLFGSMIMKYGFWLFVQDFKLELWEFLQMVNS